MPLLSQPMPAHDVDDLEKLVRRALSDELNAKNAYLNSVEFDDAVDYLIEVAWMLSRVYIGPVGEAVRQRVRERIATRAEWVLMRRMYRLARKRVQPQLEAATFAELEAALREGRRRSGRILGPGNSFSSFAYDILRKRVSSWYRYRWGSSRGGKGAAVTSSIEELELDRNVGSEDAILQSAGELNVVALSPGSRRMLALMKLHAHGVPLSQISAERGWSRRQIGEWRKDLVKEVAAQWAR